MLTRLFAVLGGVSPHNSSIRFSVGTSWPGRTSKQASSDRHLAALIAVHPPGDSTSSGPRMRKRIRPSPPSARSPRFRVSDKSGEVNAPRHGSWVNFPDLQTLTQSRLKRTVNRMHPKVVHLHPVRRRL